MQWSADTNAGFTSGTPWMRVNTDYPKINASAQLSNPHPAPGHHSVHAFWKRALECRKENKDVFVYGDFEMLDMEDDKVVAFRRWGKDKAFVTICNLSGDTVSWKKLGERKVKKWVAGNYDEGKLEEKAKSGNLVLKPWEAVLGMLE